MDKIQEELSRRNKPSAIRKKKTLDAALEKLKKKRSLKKAKITPEKLLFFGNSRKTCENSILFNFFWPKFQSEKYFPNYFFCSSPKMKNGNEK